MSLLLVLPWLIPLLAAAVTAARWAWWLPAVAALPGVLSAVLLTDGAQLELPWLLLGTSLGSDPIARLFLAFTSVLWLAAGIYSAPLMRDGPHAARFRVFFLLAMTGNLLLILGQDLVSFYLGFSLMGLAAYGLVVHDGDPAALRAGRVYLAMTLAGELALFAALVMIAQHAGSLTPERDQLVGLGDLTVGLLIFGLAIKAGLVPLHVWLPLAHPAAPVPASAVLSGAMIKVALLGWLRFLPVGEESLAGWGLLLVFAGMLSLFFAVPIGLIQSNPKVILAYSSVSKMGLLSLTLGLMLVEPALAPAGILALTLYAAHHALVKGGLFLGVGLRLHGPLQAVVLVGLVLLALSMAGMPPTSGAVAKYAMKPTLTGTDWAWLTQAVALSAAATALLMARFLWVVWRLPAHPEPGYGAGTLAWGALIVLSIAYALMLGTPAAWLSDARPVGIGLALAAAVALVAWLKPARLSPLIDRVPPGDLIALAGPLLAVGEFTIQTGARQWRRGRRFLISRGADAVTALRARAGDPETAMGTWPAAGAAWLGVLVLLLALGFAVQPLQGPPETAGPIETEAVDRETGDVDLVGGEAAEPTAPGPISDVEEAPPQDRAPTLADQDRDARPEGPDADPAPAPLDRPISGAEATPTTEPTPEPTPQSEVVLADAEPADPLPENIGPVGPAPSDRELGEPPPDQPEVEDTLPDAAERDELPPDDPGSMEGDAAVAVADAPAPAPAESQPPATEGAQGEVALETPAPPVPCDPAGSFELAHPAVTATLSLEDCRAGPEGPERIAAPPLTNDLVRLTQLHLRDLGFDPGPVDGLIGPRTRAALRAFARDVGLPPTGEISFLVLERLRAARTGGTPEADGSGGARP